MGNFFGALMEVATAPGDIPGRLVAIEEGLSLLELLDKLQAQLKV